MRKECLQINKKKEDNLGNQRPRKQRPRTETSQERIHKKPKTYE